MIHTHRNLLGSVSKKTFEAYDFRCMHVCSPNLVAYTHMCIYIFMFKSNTTAHTHIYTYIYVDLCHSDTQHALNTVSGLGCETGAHCTVHACPLAFALPPKRFVAFSSHQNAQRVAEANPGQCRTDIHQKKQNVSSHSHHLYALGLLKLSESISMPTYPHQLLMIYQSQPLAGEEPDAGVDAALASATAEDSKWSILIFTWSL